MVELDQFKYTLSTYEKPLQEVRESLNLDAKIRRIDELDKTMEEPSFWEDAELSTRLVKEAKHLKDTVAEFNRLQNQYEEIGLMIEIIKSLARSSWALTHIITSEDLMLTTRLS